MVKIPYKKRNLDEPVLFQCVDVGKMLSIYEGIPHLFQQNIHQLSVDAFQVQRLVDA